MGGMTVHACQVPISEEVSDLGSRHAHAKMSHGTSGLVEAESDGGLLAAQDGVRQGQDHLVSHVVDRPVIRV